MIIVHPRSQGRVILGSNCLIVPEPIGLVVLLGQKLTNSARSRIRFRNQERHPSPPVTHPVSDSLLFGKLFAEEQLQHSLPQQLSKLKKN